MNISSNLSRLFVVTMVMVGVACVPEDPTEPQGEVGGGEGGSGGSSSSSVGGGSTSSGTGDPEMGTGGAGAGGSATGAGGEATTVDPGTKPDGSMTCEHTCVTSEDCTTFGDAIYGPDNYACDEGLCVYLGCKSDGECLESHNDPAWTCRQQPGDAVPLCHPKCVTAHDCVDPSSPLHNTDNWSCNGGACEHRGCTSDDECSDEHHNPHYGCVKLPGDVVPVCRMKCHQANDCDNPAEPLYDLDNWACNSAGYCVHLGCGSTSECTQTLNDPDFVCH